MPRPHKQSVAQNLQQILILNSFIEKDMSLQLHLKAYNSALIFTATAVTMLLHCVLGLFQPRLIFEKKGHTIRLTFLILLSQKIAELSSNPNGITLWHRMSFS